MRYFISCSLLVLMLTSLFFVDASAGRFGGGRSFGVQRSSSSLFSSRPAYQGAKSYANRPNTGRWASALGGLVMGGLLASLFMGHGLGTGILTWLMLGALVLFLVGFFRKRMQPAMQSGPFSAFQQQSTAFNPAAASSSNGAANTIPQGFNAESFLRAAKVTFIRLQAAYDQKNLQDLAEFTAPDVFAEIKMQLDERGDTPNTTEVISLEAELLDISKQVHELISSVRFTGFVKENNEPMTQLDEIWHFRQFADRDTWVVAGIQQEVVKPN